MCVFGQEDASGLYGKQSKAGLFFSLKIKFKGQYLFSLFISHLKALYVLGESVQACFACVSKTIYFPSSLQGQDVSCPGIRCSAPARLEGEVLWPPECLRWVCPDTAWAGAELPGLGQGKAAGERGNGQMWNLSQ